MVRRKCDGVLSSGFGSAAVEFGGLFDGDGYYYDYDDYDAAAGDDGDYHRWGKTIVEPKIESTPQSPRNQFRPSSLD